MRLLGLHPTRGKSLPCFLSLLCHHHPPWHPRTSWASPRPGTGWVWELNTQRAARAARAARACRHRITWLSVPVFFYCLLSLPVSAGQAASSESWVAPANSMTGMLPHACLTRPLPETTNTDNTDPVCQNLGRFAFYYNPTGTGGFAPMDSAHFLRCRITSAALHRP